MSIADAEDEPLDDRFEALPTPHDLEDELPQAGEAPLVEELVELPGDAHGDELDPADDTADDTADHTADDTAHEAAADLAERAVADDVPSGSEGFEQDDPTDRLPPVVATEAEEPDLFAAGDEDLLRTTAQLAMLADDLEQRSRR
jgi:ankyrin repeat protein